MPKVLVPIADGTEDIELSCMTDILRRADFHVTVTSVMENPVVRLSRGLTVTADSVIENESADAYDGVFLPGGLPGADHLGKSAHLKKILESTRANGKWYGAICASPIVAFGPLGMLEGIKTITCYPAMKDKVPSPLQWSADPVVRCGKCLTSMGPGTAMAFGLAIVACLATKELASNVAKDLLVDGTQVVDQMFSKI
ncbi:putative DJ 1 PfpI family [Trypanosoma vivax]|uniref:Putative 4-methyl-5(Beta-hydroxyethyl)-thiazole monophosphate synthesis protein n=1 Tax=Trypanosoma vivax (strain Y486) TaxID=1055687 RepID=G0TWP3_TRYVY|nr:putative 4-methyl-5(beta-hydroxyethyl)-thiazole monophosphate synthesis protein [Trypanosoma vivax]KAH8614032.1 putative DJ 1 PfpI family [Trypanosoma vivax]CCC48381.1 putative 4-methyl-5(beta-hydroxyethyl)-thiazole monophosphate synthesis protein [Trypanosoma vivax Y486]